MKPERNRILACLVIVFLAAAFWMLCDHATPKHATLPELYALHNNDTGDWTWAYEPFGPDGESRWAKRYFDTSQQAIEDAWKFESGRIQPVKTNTTLTTVSSIGPSASMSQPLSSHPDPHLLLESPIRVTWAESKEGHPEYKLVAEHSDSRVSVDTWCGRPDETPPSPAALHDRLANEYVRFIGGYLFLRADGGGGNSAFSSVDYVFKVAGDRLCRIGFISAHIGNRPGDQFDGVHFHDYFGQLTTSELIPARADVPDFLLMLREQAGAFVVDIDATWNAAMPDYRKALTWLQQAAQVQRPPSSKEYESWKETPAIPALYCLALTRYCNRTNEFQTALVAAARVLGNILPLLNEVRQIIPGERNNTIENDYRESLQ